MKKSDVGLTALKESLQLLKREYEDQGFEVIINIKQSDRSPYSPPSYIKFGVVYTYEDKNRIFSKLFLSTNRDTVCSHELATNKGMRWAKEQFRREFDQRKKDKQQKEVA